MDLQNYAQKMAGFNQNLGKIYVFYGAITKVVTE